MKKEIIKKLNLVVTEINSGVSFVNDIKIYRYGEYLCMAGNDDGTFEKDGLILFFNRRTGISVKMSNEFLIDSEIEAIDEILSNT